MNVSLATPTLAAPAPNFLGIVRGELFKLSRQWVTWLGALAVMGPVVIYLLFLIATPSVKPSLLGPEHGAYLVIQFEREMALLRSFAGFLLIALTVLIFGQDYQAGTIRITLSRGVSRLQLFGAKLLTALLVMFGLATVYLVLTFALSYFAFGATAGTFSIFSGLPSDFGSLMWSYIATVLITMTATVLMATMMTVIGRSVAFGMGLGMLFFPADNIVPLFARLISNFTHQQFFNNFTAYLLGPTLNTLPTTWLPSHWATVATEGGPLFEHVTAETIGFQPLVNYGNTHNVVLVALYCLVFLGVAVYLTWRRDVLE